MRRNSYRACEQPSEYSSHDARPLATRRQFENRFQALARQSFDTSYEGPTGAEGHLFDEALTQALSRLLRCNQALQRDGWMALVHPEDRARADAHRQRVLSGRRDVCVFRVVRPEGSLCWIGSLARPVWGDRQGRVDYVFGLLQDLSRRSANATARWSNAGHRPFPSPAAA